MLASLLKPSYIAIAVLLAILGLQTWRLSAAHLETAQVVAEKATLVADIATARTEGVLEGQRQRKAAEDLLTEKHRQIVAGLEKDKAALQKHYDDTYKMLQGFAGTERWGCLKEPLPENILENFRR
jgi:hypothetical protein